MLLIHCPSCAAGRPETEFVCAGPVPPVRPSPPETVSAATWANYLHHAPNPRGMIGERWCHRAGCGTWVVVWRDTVSHRIQITTRLSDPAPELL